MSDDRKDEVRRNVITLAGWAFVLWFIAFVYLFSIGDSPVP